MKAKISATFERYFQHKAYDGEKIVLSVEQDIDDVDPPAAAAALHRRLAEIGDEVTAQRLSGKGGGNSRPQPPKDPSQDRSDW